MSRSIFVGDIFPTSCGVPCRVVKYESDRKITVQFMDEFKYEAVRGGQQLRRGNIKNPFHRSVFGVGFLGVGKYKGKIDRAFTKEYAAWRGMMTRCYHRLRSGENISYSDCSVHPDWHNFQVFSEWFVEQKFNSAGYDLDKDLLSPGNKVYSATACALVPREINSLITDRRAYRGGLPVGVSAMPSGKYRAYTSRGGRYIHGGVYETPEAAAASYRRAREQMVKEVAQKWKGRIDDPVFNALMGWRAPIDL